MLRKCRVLNGVARAVLKENAVARYAEGLKQPEGKGRFTVASNQLATASGKQNARMRVSPSELRNDRHTLGKFVDDDLVTRR